MLSPAVLIYDPIAVWGLVVAIIGVVVGIVAAMAAIYAAYYSKKAPTADDLAKVEQNTAHLEEVRTTISSVDSRLKKQEDAAAIRIRANRVSIVASGNMAGTVPFPLQLFVRGPKPSNLSLTHVELCNEHGTSFGSFFLCAYRRPYLSKLSVGYSNDRDGRVVPRWNSNSGNQPDAPYAQGVDVDGRLRSPSRNAGDSHRHERLGRNRWLYFERECLI